MLGPDQQTSMAGVYAVGDCAGIWPSKTLDRSIAEAEGRRAACAILRQHGVGTEAPVATAPDVAGYDISEYRLAWVRASIVEARADCHVCQCEEVTASEILEIRTPRYLGWSDSGRNDRNLSSLLGSAPPNPDQIKRLTRAGMGPCQGRRCREQVRGASRARRRAATLGDPTHWLSRAFRPMPLALAGQLPAPPGLDEHWDSWFGMHGQWRPFWDVPEFYTVAGNADGGPGLSE